MLGSLFSKFGLAAATYVLAICLTFAATQASAQEEPAAQESSPQAVQESIPVPELSDPNAPVAPEIPAALPAPAPVPAAEASPTPPDDGLGLLSRLQAEGLDLLPQLSFLADELVPDGLFAAAAAGNAPLYQAWRHPVQEGRSGGLWLKINLNPLPVSTLLKNTAGEGLVLDLGRVPAGTQVWWLSGKAEDSPRPLPAGKGNTFPLPANTITGQLLIHLEGPPSLWFSPLIRSVSQALFSWERQLHNLSLAILAALALLCIVRGMAERREGRMWAGLFAIAAMLHYWLPLPVCTGGSALAASLEGLPGAGISLLLLLLANAPALVGAALALLLLPHVGRIIMSTDETSPAADIVFLLLAIPGALLILLPMLPGLAWATPLLDLWPLGAALCLLPTLPLIMRQVPGSGLYTLACFSLIAGGGVALWGAQASFFPRLTGELPLFASLLAAFFMAAAPRYVYAYVLDGENGTPEASLDDSPEAEAARAGSEGKLGLTEQWLLGLNTEENLRVPLDEILREGNALHQLLDGSKDLPREEMWRARVHSDKLMASCRDMAALVGDIPRLVASGSPESQDSQIFDLRKLVQELFADIQAQSPEASLGLAWYIAPHIGLMYLGDRDRLYLILNMLLMDAVRATGKGTVSLRVNREEMSTNPGHLRFTVSDSGQGKPPLERGSIMLARVWELAAANNGNLQVNCSPLGTEISFSLDFTALSEGVALESAVPPVNPREVTARREGPPLPDPALIIVASNNPLNRQMLAFYLQGQQYKIWEARSTEEAVDLYFHSPAALTLFDCHMHEEDIIAAIADIRAIEGEYDLPASAFLCLQLEEKQAERLYQAGCDFFLPQPVQRGELRALVDELARDPSLAKARPSLSPRPHAAPLAEETLLTRESSEAPADDNQEATPDAVPESEEATPSEAPAAAEEAPLAQPLLESTPQSEAATLAFIPPLDPSPAAELSGLNLPDSSQSPDLPDSSTVSDQTLSPDAADEAQEATPPEQAESADPILESPALPDEILTAAPQDDEAFAPLLLEPIGSAEISVTPLSLEPESPQSQPSEAALPDFAEAEPTPESPTEAEPHETVDEGTDEEAKAAESQPQAPAPEMALPLVEQDVETEDEVPAAASPEPDVALSLIDLPEAEYPVTVEARQDEPDRLPEPLAESLPESQAEPLPAPLTEPLAAPAWSEPVPGPELTPDLTPEPEPHISEPQPVEDASLPTHDAAPRATARAVRPEPAPVLHVPPPPKKELGWFSRLFKPTPKVEPPAEEEHFSFGGVWISDPVPVSDSTDKPQAPAPESDAAWNGVNISLADASWTEGIGEPTPRLPDPSPASEAASAGALPEPAPIQKPISGKTSLEEISPYAAVPGEFVGEPMPVPKAAPQAVPDAQPIRLVPEEPQPSASKEEVAPLKHTQLTFDGEAPARQSATNSGEKSKKARPRMPEPLLLPGIEKPAPKEEKTEDRPRPSLTFLSLDPNAKLDAEPNAEPESEHILDLTEAEMLASPVLEQMLPEQAKEEIDLDEALLRAASAIDSKDGAELEKACALLVEHAKNFALHALEDMATFMTEAAGEADFDSAAQLLPELQAEVERHRS